MASDIFISYAREDRPRAQLLAQALEAAGYSVWWDRDIIPGQSFDHAIERALDAAGCVVVCWSGHSVGSEWVRSEAAAGAERGVLVPIMFDEARLPLEFRRKQTVSLVGWNGDAAAEGFADVLTGIRAAIRHTPSTGARESAGVTKSVVSHTPLRQRRNWIRFAMVGVVAVALLAGAVWFYLTRQPDETSGAGVPFPVTARLMSGDVAVSKAVFSPRGYLIAMRHGLPKPDRVEVEWDDGNARRRATAAVLKQGVLSSELVLLQLKDRPLVAMPFTVRIAATLKTGDNIERYIAGNDRAPGQVKEIFASMTVHGGEAKPAKLDRLLRTTHISGPGDSGAPVLDAEGRVVGLVYGGSETETVSLMIEDVKASFPEAF